MMSLLPELMTRLIPVTLQELLDMDRFLSPIPNPSEPVDSDGRLSKRLRFLYWGTDDI